MKNNTVIRKCILDYGKQSFTLHCLQSLSPSLSFYSSYFPAYSHQPSIFSPHFSPTSSSTLPLFRTLTLPILPSSLPLTSLFSLYPLSLFIFTSSLHLNLCPSPSCSLSPLLFIFAVVLSLSLFIYLYLSLPLSLPPSLPPSLSLSLSVSLSLPLPPSLSLSP